MNDTTANERGLAPGAAPRPPDPVRRARRSFM